MATDILEIFGSTYSGVTGIKATDSNNQTKTYIRPEGTKSITANGNNQDVVGYAAVNVAVPNSYSAGDEGKVVDDGALVAQTAHADVTPTTSDQTIDTTTNNSIKVKGDADLVAGNIKKDVEIFGVTGSYEGGGGDIDALIDGSIVSVESDATVVEEYKFYNCTHLDSVKLNGVVWIKGNAFRGCTALQTFDAKKTYKIFGNAFMDVPADAIVCPNITGEMGSSAFASFKGTKLDLGGSNLEIKIAAFSNATNLNVIILRKTSRVVLAHTGAFDGTPFKSGGTGGTIYIPKALYDHLGDNSSLDYQHATNWSTVYGYGTITFMAIEGSAYENYYADGTPIT